MKSSQLSYCSSLASPAKSHPSLASPLRSALCVGAFALATLVLPSAQASSTNLAAVGVGISGVNSNLNVLGTLVFNSGSSTNINDRNFGSRVDTFRANDPSPNSFGGIIWSATRYEAITNITFTHAVFLDGGWFGQPGYAPAAGSPLDATNLVQPVIQTTTDKGVTWTTVPGTSDYLSVMTGKRTGGGGQPNPTNYTSQFFPTAPISGVNGIRIIGTNGGKAGADTNGFLGIFEVQVLASFVDTDNDGMDDNWEIAHGLNVGINDSAEDPDGDGLTNLQEYANNADPQNFDTDGDGLGDGDEVLTYLTNPAVMDTDGDGLSDGDEVNTYFTNPKLVDSDGDTLSDGAEVNTYHTNPLAIDTDGDGFSDSLEVTQGSDPNNANNYPENIALIGAGIMGTRPNFDTGPDTPYAQQGLAAINNIKDGNLTTRVDTYNGAVTNLLSYVGIAWTNTISNSIVGVDLTSALFGDGGWFGKNDAGPGAGNPLSSTYLIEPLMQVSTDGTNWTTVDKTSDYLLVLNGLKIGGNGQPNPVTVTTHFTLSVPATAIRGIRLLGNDGGTASHGFLGVFEFKVRTTVTDTDNDGMDDGWERLHGLNVGVNDAALDPDGDGLTNFQEFKRNTDPQLADTDGDGLSDGAEVNTYHTNPLNPDSDSDGLSDGAEVNTYHSNPLVKDSDGDGFLDGVEVARGTNPADPNSFPDNLALIGFGIIGTRDAVDSGVETPYEHAGSAAVINDGLVTATVDTWNNTTPGTASYVGIRWTNTLNSPIVFLDLTMATFGDGGWFGVNNVSPAPGGALTPAHLAAPSIQVTTNGGVDWTFVSGSSDYLTVMNGHHIGGGSFPNPTAVTTHFVLDQPATNINGIRLIGTEGGIASGGFIGVYELTARTDADSDHDGMSDFWEMGHGLIVGVDDSAGDPDGDGLTNLEEYTRHTDPQVADTDGDGLSDGAEAHTYHTNPLIADSDADGLSDGAEVNTYHTNPLVIDTDGDGFPDGIEVAKGSDPANAASIPANLALIGTGIVGTADAIDGSPGTPLANAGSPASVNDGDTNTHVDTYNGVGLSQFSFVGVTWSHLITNPIVKVQLNTANFFDGGWFGANNAGPGSGHNLDLTYLVEPTVQVTTDGGATWSTASATSDYLTVMNGQPLPAVDFGAPTLGATATFQLDVPQVNINGIRLIGTEGGTASGGFLGVFEFAALRSVPQAVTIQNVGIVGGLFQFRFQSQAGMVHHIQFKNSLSDLNWQPLQTITGDGTDKFIADTPDGLMRIYRVVTE